MKVFISYSGKVGKALAKALRSWLRGVLPDVEPFVAASDIPPGTRWRSQLASQLEQCQCGILCVTVESLSSRWIPFEAGALSKSTKDATLCPILFNVSPKDLPDPLEQFQALRFEQEAMEHLIAQINRALGDQAVAEDLLAERFARAWPDIAQRVEAILADDGHADHADSLRSTVRLWPRSSGQWLVGVAALLVVIVIASSRLVMVPQSRPIENSAMDIETLGESAGKAFPAPITVANTSRYIGRAWLFLGKPWWRWEIFIKAPPEILSRIDEVTYTLHSTFNPDTVRGDKRCKGPDRAFPFSAKAYGTFSVEVQIKLEDGTTCETVHPLTFD